MVSEEVIKQELATIETAEGRLVPSTVVDAARAPDSPLHPLFEWDDSAAAEKYRLDQARTIIRRVTVTVTTQEETVTIPAYVHDPEAPPRVERYKRVQVIAQNEAETLALMRQEIGRAQGLVTRVRDVARVLRWQRTLAAIVRELAALKAELDKAA